MDKKLLVFIIGGIIGAIWGSCTHARPPHHYVPTPKHHHYHSHSNGVVLGAIGIVTGLAVLSALSKPRQKETIVLREVPKNTVVFWCESQRGFYPEVRACPEGWRPLEVK